MEAFTLLKFAHIATLFFAIALAISGEVVVRRVAASRDVRSIRTVVERVKLLSGPLSGMLFMVGIALGVLAALSGGFDLFRPWLLMSYAAVAAAFAIGITVTGRCVVGTGDSGALQALNPRIIELVALIDDRKARYATVALMALIVLLVFLMVAKPLG